MDIARLRFWLSLVVDEESPEVLPNLEFKIMQGNSLLECYKGIDLSGLAGEKYKRTTKISKDQTSLVFDEEQAMKQIQKDLNRFYTTESHTEKENLTHAINDGVKNYIKIIAPQMNKEIEAMQLPNDKFFLWHTYFRDVFDRKGKSGFDIVIGNPPYKPLQDNQGFLANIYEDKGFEVFDRGGDIYSLFFEQGASLLSSKATLCFITSSQWLRAGYGEKLRKYLSKLNPKLLIDFTGVKVFDATVDPCITLFSKEKNTEKTIATKTKPFGREILPELNKFVKENAYECSFVDGESWVILDIDEKRLKDKIKQAGLPLQSYGITIYRGILTGCNEAFIISAEIRNKILSNCRTNDEKYHTEELIRPVLRGRDIRKFGYIENGLYQINTHNGVKKHHIPRINIDNYPSVKEHLNQFIEKLSSRSDRGDTPYNLRNCAYQEDFSAPKIVYPETTVRRSEFFYDESGILLDKTCFFLSGNNLKFILGILTSKMMEWFLERECRLLGRTTIQYSKQWMSNIPIPAVPPAQQKPIIDLVDSILTAKKKKPTANTFEQEKEIDKLVYDLYGLTEPEINIIKGQNSSSSAQNDESNQPQQHTQGTDSINDYSSFLQGEDL